MHTHAATARGRALSKLINTLAPKPTVLSLLTNKRCQDSQTQPERIKRAGDELDVARHQSLEIADQGGADERATRIGLFWSGYLAAQVNSHPELAELLAELPALLTGNASAPVITSTATHNTLGGTVHGPVVQAGDIQGSVTFGNV